MRNTGPERIMTVIIRVIVMVVVVGWWAGSDDHGLRTKEIRC